MGGKGMKQLRYTIQQYNLFSKTQIKLSHANLYHCEDNNYDIFPGYPYSKILYVLNGSGQFICDDTCVPVNEKDFIITNPHKHRFSIELDSPALDFVILGIENLNFIIDDEPMKEAIRGITLKSDIADTLMNYLLQEIQEQKKEYEAVCNYYLNVILIELHRHTNIFCNISTKEKKAKDCRFVRDYLDKHFRENITLDLLSEKSNMNKYYLVHSFTKNFGCSPINYLNEKRIEESKRLLETTNYSIAEIADQIGFSSQSYFSQSFKKNTYMTPNEYRRSTRLL